MYTLLILLASISRSDFDFPPLVVLPMKQPIWQQNWRQTLTQQDRGQLIIKQNWRAMSLVSQRSEIHAALRSWRSQVHSSIQSCGWFVNQSKCPRNFFHKVAVDSWTNQNVLAMFRSTNWREKDWMMVGPVDVISVTWTFTHSFAAAALYTERLPADALDKIASKLTQQPAPAGSAGQNESQQVQNVGNEADAPLRKIADKMKKAIEVEVEQQRVNALKSRLARYNTAKVCAFHIALMLLVVTRLLLYNFA